ncbi:MAG: alpha/beta fold hydrolase [Pseudomonadota bacterium]
MTWLKTVTAASLPSAAIGLSRRTAAGNVARLNPAPRTFVLIHGGWHGAWCWERLATLLRADGHMVIAPDLPSMGDDPTDPATVTLSSWTKFVLELIAAQSERVILVGHSRAGAIISQVAEAVPGRILRLVYLSAYLLPGGRSVAAEARQDADSLVPANMVPGAGGVTCTLRPEIVSAAFYGECSEAERAFAIARLSPEPLKPLAAAVQVTAQRFGGVPRVYVECNADRTISLAAQRRMQAALPCDPVFTLDCDHSPFLSRPAELARLLGGL